ncbi:hypothetical protein ACCO45_006868 [Purpureocillium lilacinum]|uniref:Uncharacterized protein n=1 Tax=Purpureocillium lilacinum TaxID=33203 RepID=A0ACC4DTE1_PURLI
MEKRTKCSAPRPGSPTGLSVIWPCKLECWQEWWYLGVGVLWQSPDVTKLRRAAVGRMAAAMPKTGLQLAQGHGSGAGADHVVTANPQLPTLKSSLPGLGLTKVRVDVDIDVDGGRAHGASPGANLYRIAPNRRSGDQSTGAARAIIGMA